MCRIKEERLLFKKLVKLKVDLNQTSIIIQSTDENMESDIFPKCTITYMVRSSIKTSFVNVWIHISKKCLNQIAY